METETDADNRSRMIREAEERKLDYDAAETIKTNEQLRLLRMAEDEPASLQQENDSLRGLLSAGFEIIAGAREERVTADREAANLRLALDDMKANEAQRYAAEIRQLRKEVARLEVTQAAFKTRLDTAKAEARTEALEEAAERMIREIDVFQDIVGWQPGESRNKLVCDIAEKMGGILRSMAATPPTADAEPKAKLT